MVALLSSLAFLLPLVSAVEIGVDKTSCTAAKRFSPLNMARLEVMDLAAVAAEKAHTLAQTNIAAAWLAGNLVDEQIFRTYQIFQTFFPLDGHGQQLTQASIQTVAIGKLTSILLDKFINFHNNLNNPAFGPGTIQIWCGDRHIEQRQVGTDANGQPILRYFDTDKVPEVEMHHTFQKCADLPTTNAYAFNGGSDIIVCDYAWRRKKQDLYVISGFRRNPQSIQAGDSLDDYSLITGTLAHELFHTYMGFHNDHQVVFNGQMVGAYGTWGVMELAQQAPANTLDNCESIMLAAIAMFLDGWRWHEGYATAL
ncbi:hypothetical protein EJ04DRAFT_548493 [Polyplosphaeria fusca]|uniref:Uncharacterized protein n=1 Tax=Polyplosphaeria fusca TaxID=682080 RepID=A0A9P4V5C0_9PLEO|nr:hypothetical protein EJ04DRAFT_548493 [Polyplosphaeria fusca]